MTEERPGGGPGIHRSESIEDLHHLRLMALLDEMVRNKGVRKAAEDLDVDHRTLGASLASGRLTRRMRAALNQALLSGAGPPARDRKKRGDEVAGRLEKVEEQVQAVAEGSGRDLDAVLGEVEAQGRALRSIEGRLATVESSGGGAEQGESGTDGPPQEGRPKPRREFPDLAALEPADDDEEVFGDAWELIREWRELRETHPDRGKGLEWLRQEERLMSVELALLEEHGLTLPPQTYPLRGLDRGGQVNWRRKSLENARRARKRQERLIWLVRALTLRIWRK